MSSPLVQTPEKYTALDSQYFTDAEAQSLAKEVPNIQVLRLSGKSQVTDKGLEALTQNCHQVVEAYFDKLEKVTPKAVVAFCLANQYSLVKLSLYGFPYLSSTHVKIICSTCPLFRSVHTDNRTLSKQEFLEVAPLMTLFREIDYNEKNTILTKFPNRRVSHFDTLSPSDLITLAEKSLLIEEFSSSMDINDNLLIHGISNWKNLRVLYLTNSQEITDKGLQVLAKSCPHLEKVTLNKLSSLTDKGIQAFMHCKNLRLLKVDLNQNVSLQTLSDLIEACPHLQDADFLMSSPLLSKKQLTDLRSPVLDRGLGRFVEYKLKKEITDEGLYNILNTDHDFNRFKLHPRLNLSGCTQLTDASLDLIKKKGSHLIGLNLEGCRFSEEAIADLIKTLPALEELNLSFRNWDPNLSLSSLLDTIAQHCESLKKLNLSYSRPTEKGISRIARFCPELRVLSLRGDSILTDRVIEEGLQHLSHLTHVYFGISSISNVGMKLFISKQPHLQELSLGNNPHLNSSILETLAIATKNLTYLDISGCPLIVSSNILPILKKFPSLNQISRSPEENQRRNQISLPPYSPRKEDSKELFSPRSPLSPRILSSPTSQEPSAPPFEYPAKNPSAPPLAK